jgi:hypothetical protein
MRGRLNEFFTLNLWNGLEYDIGRSPVVHIGQHELEHDLEHEHDLNLDLVSNPKLDHDWQQFDNHHIIDADDRNATNVQCGHDNRHIVLDANDGHGRNVVQRQQRFVKSQQ